MLRAVMSAFCYWPIECVWNKINLYELLILLFLSSLFFSVTWPPNSTRKSKHFQTWKIGGNHLIGRWMEPELSIDPVEKRTEKKNRSPVIELLITVISESDYSCMQSGFMLE